MRTNRKANLLTRYMVALLMVPFAAAQQTGSWGDQGNGTYKNPILESNYPDNDVIRAGDTFYMMSSTNHFTPGMVVLKSQDLVNWEFSNPIMPVPVTFDPSFTMGRKMAMASQGTWAGSFGHDGKQYFAYWCFNKNFLKPNGGYVMVYAKADSMEGPWSEPREVTFADGSPINTTDPGVFWDLETKQAWMGIHYKGFTRVYPLAWEGDKLLQNENQGFPVTKEFQGEAVKIYKFDGMFYVMNAHWRVHEKVRQRMAVFMRSKSMEGPWEGRLAMENGNGTDRCPSQGTLLKLDDNSWWFIHQLARGEAMDRYNGRPQMLEPVTWKDGWPLIGTDTDGDGIGEVVWEHRKPITGFPIVAPATDDDFSKAELGQQWYWRFNPLMDRWSLKERPGFLRLKACAPEAANSSGSLDTLPNLLSQRLMGRHGNVMTAKFDLAGLANGQEGGLHVSAYDNHCIGVRKDTQGALALFFKSSVKGNMVVKDGPALKATDLWLQARVENGLATFFYSLDGETFTRLGDEVRLAFAGFTSNAVGFYTMNAEPKGHLDVDWFKYDYDGPKVLSLIHP